MVINKHKTNEELLRYTSYAELIEAARNGAAKGQWALLETRSGIVYKPTALHRLLYAANAMNAVLVYSDRLVKRHGKLTPHPVTDYQLGSIRDDFDFGSVLLLDMRLVSEFVSTCGEARRYRYAGLYALRLFLSRKGTLFHLNEALYTEDDDCAAESPQKERKLPQGGKQFEYVDTSNREVQIEMEQAAACHLQLINALIDPAKLLRPDFSASNFPVEASVVIPVRNRERTIRDAVESALSQKCKFEYNIIVVDNHSADKTNGILHELADGNRRVKLIEPLREDLGIGGCWNEAVNSAFCGRFAVQLDSDDLYSSPSSLQTIVDAFYEQRAAMVIGSYRICDFNLTTLPPGLVSHSEWTDGNGANNALRINGLGAPRAFFTPILRRIQFPDTSYGEDYAVELAFSRAYKTGRIYDELYLCRRWEGNSDASLPVEQENKNNAYKDKLRTIEIMERIRMNNNNGENKLT